MESVSMFSLAFVMCTITVKVDSLECYRCDSYASWPDCDLTRSLVTCPSDAESCTDVYVETARATIFTRGCDTAYHCTYKPICADTIACHVFCCYADFCNGRTDLGPNPVAEKPQQCYACASNSSENCARNQKIQTCGVEHYHCARITGESGGKRIFLKSCATNALCESSKRACDQIKLGCSVDCCSKSLCNAARINIVSEEVIRSMLIALMLLTCT